MATGSIEIKFCCDCGEPDCESNRKLVLAGLPPLQLIIAATGALKELTPPAPQSPLTSAGLFASSLDSLRREFMEFMAEDDDGDDDETDDEDPTPSEGTGEKVPKESESATEGGSEAPDTNEC